MQLLLLTQANEGKKKNQPKIKNQNPKQPQISKPSPSKSPHLPRSPPPGPSFTAGRRELPSPRAAEDLCASVTKGGERGPAAALTAGEEPPGRAGGGRPGAAEEEEEKGKMRRALGGPARPGTERSPGTGRPRPRGEARGGPSLRRADAVGENAARPISGAVPGQPIAAPRLGERCRGYGATRCARRPSSPCRAPAAAGGLPREWPGVRGVCGGSPAALFSRAAHARAVPARGLRGGSPSGGSSHGGPGSGLGREGRVGSRRCPAASGQQCATACLCKRPRTQPQAASFCPFIATLVTA